MALSKEVAWNLTKAVEAHDLVLKLHPTGTYKNTVRNGFFHAFCGITVEHLGAIIILLRSEQFCGSAFALLRPLVEASLRALWLIHVADDDLVVKIAKRENTFPKLSVIYAAVEKVLMSLASSNRVLFMNPTLKCDA